MIFNTLLRRFLFPLLSFLALFTFDDLLALFLLPHLHLEVLSDLRVGNVAPHELVLADGDLSQLFGGFLLLLGRLGLFLVDGHL